MNETVGETGEALKWGELAYLTTNSGSGSKVRIAWKPKNVDQIGVYFNRRTTLVDTYRGIFPELSLEGNQAILLSLSEAAQNVLRGCKDFCVNGRIMLNRDSVPKQDNKLIQRHLPVPDRHGPFLRCIFQAGQLEVMQAEVVWQALSD